MIRVSEGVYEDVKRSDILKEEMFLDDKDGGLTFSSNFGKALYLYNYNHSVFDQGQPRTGNCFIAKGHDVTKHMIGRTVGEAIDWIKTKSDGAK